MKWHIARISHKSNARCGAQQSNSNMKCIARTAKGSKGTPTPTYRGRKLDYGSRREVMVDFWFYWDDIEGCVKGTIRKWILDWPEVPSVWPVFTSTNLSHEETLLLQHVEFQLQEWPVLSPHRFFTMSNVFETVVYDHPTPTNSNVFPTVRNNKIIRRIATSPTPEQRNKWESAANVNGMILEVTFLPFLGLSAILTLETRREPKKNVYRITVGMFSSCTCPNFINMVVSAIGGQQQYVNCKHLYYLYKYFCKMDVINDKFIHAPSYNFNELKQLLVQAKIITIV